VLNVPDLSLLAIQKLANVDFLPTLLKIVGFKVTRLLNNEAFPNQQIPAENSQNFRKLAF